MHLQKKPSHCHSTIQLRLRPNDRLCVFATHRPGNRQHSMRAKQGVCYFRARSTRPRCGHRQLRARQEHRVARHAPPPPRRCIGASPAARPPVRTATEHRPWCGERRPCRAGSVAESATCTANASIVSGNERREHVGDSTESTRIDETKDDTITARKMEQNESELQRRQEPRQHGAVSTCAPCS